MKNGIVLIFGIFLIAFESCRGSGEGVETITVASQKASCVGVARTECLLIKHRGSDQWEFLHGGIEGFTHESGYEYRLRIREERIENPPADRSSIRRILVKVISKKKKTSSDLPVSAIFP